MLQQGLKLGPPEITATGAWFVELIELDDERTLELDDVGGGHVGGGVNGLTFGTVLQVLRDMQLRWFSQPQPLWVVTHKG